MSISKQQWERLQEIQDEMIELREEAKQIVLDSRNYYQYERAKSYWMSYLDGALEDAKSPMLDCTMGDTIAALKPDDIDNDDEDNDDENGGD